MQAAAICVMAKLTGRQLGAPGLFQIFNVLQHPAAAQQAQQQHSRHSGNTAGTAASSSTAAQQAQQAQQQHSSRAVQSSAEKWVSPSKHVLEQQPGTQALTSSTLQSIPHCLDGCQRQCIALADGNQRPPRSLAGGPAPFAMESTAPGTHPQRLLFH